MRRRLSTNLCRAGFRPTRALIDRYFRRFGAWVGWSLAVYHHGFVGSGVARKVSFDSSVAHLDQAMVLGKGAILICPHGFCHELGAAAINCRYPLAAIVRESKDPARDAIKQHWYRATGIPVVRRPRRSSLLADTLLCLGVLRRGQALGITPDILVSPDKGINVRFLGRQVCLSPGAAMLAQKTGAPIVPCWAEWIEDPSGVRDDRVVLSFDEPIRLERGGGLQERARDILQAWCRNWEVYLQRHTDNWMFWLDKRWTRVLRGRA
jgi:lauroyl/myristoyl acyltransferase